MRLRIAIALAFVLLAPLVLPAPAEAEEAGERARAVLEALSTAVHGTASPQLNSRDLLHTAIVEEEVPEAGRALHVPVLPPHCGLTTYGGPDLGEAGALLRRIFAAYGHIARPGARIAVDGGELELDGFDETTKVGFLFLPPALGDARSPVPEVDPSVRARLQAGGKRILLAPLHRYRSSQGDSLSPLLALAMSTVGFLNENTPGDDVDVHGLAAAAPLELSLPRLDADDVPTASTFQFEGGNAFFVSETKGTLELSFRAPAKEASAGTGTGVGLLILPWYARTLQGGSPSPGALPRFVLRQGDLELESRRAVFVIPPTFDRTKPFALRVDFGPGQSFLGGPLTLRLP